MGGVVGGVGSGPNVGLDGGSRGEESLGGVLGKEFGVSVSKHAGVGDSSGEFIGEGVVPSSRGSGSLSGLWRLGTWRSL